MPPLKMISVISAYTCRSTEPVQTIPVFILILISMFLVCPASADSISMPLAETQYPVKAVFADRWQWEEGRVRPVAIDVHSSGQIVCLEERRHRLFLLTADGDWVGYGDPGGGDFGFAEKVFARFGLLLFSLDTEERAVDYFDLGGRWQGRLDLEETAAASGEELSETTDFCIDPGGDLFVLEGDSGRILRFDRSGALISIIGQWGSLQPAAPIAIEIDGYGQLYLLETNPPALMVLETDGQVKRHHLLTDEVSSNVETSDTGSEFQPAALAVDQWGNAYIADSYSGAILVLAAVNGENRRQSEAKGNGASPPLIWIYPPDQQQMSVDDLVVDETGRLLATDAQRASVWVFDLSFASDLSGASDSREP